MNIPCYNLFTMEICINYSLGMNHGRIRFWSALRKSWISPTYNSHIAGLDDHNAIMVDPLNLESVVSVPPPSQTISSIKANQTLTHTANDDIKQNAKVGAPRLHRAHNQVSPNLTPTSPPRTESQRYYPAPALDGPSPRSPRCRYKRHLEILRLVVPRCIEPRVWEH
jgi:hypothetical protein